MVRPSQYWEKICVGIRFAFKLVRQNRLTTVFDVVFTTLTVEGRE